jgi:8-hydroxy-5-deazaflavin:NADPH oxidoreductase
MNITVIGAGNMGSAFVKKLHKAGHTITVTSKDMVKAKEVAAAYTNVRAANASESSLNAELIILATGYADAATALQPLGNLAGKIIVDITNPLTADYMGLTIGHSTSAAEEIAKLMPQAFVVKAFNTVFASVLGDDTSSIQGNKVSVFIAGDSEKAKETVKQIAASMGFEPVDAGNLKNARYLEPLAGLNIYFGYGAGLGTNIAPAWLRKA